MTADDFVSAIDGVTFDENGRTWTLEVDDVDDSPPETFSITVCIPEAESTMQFDTPRGRQLDQSEVRGHVIGVARDLVIGRQPSGVRTRL